MSMTIEEFAKAALTEPDSFYTSCEWAYTTHGRWMTRSRDSDALGLSNWVTVQNDMTERFPDDVEILQSSHWAVGWVDEMFVRVYAEDGSFTPAFVAFHEWFERLAEYPVLDEDDLSEREFDEAIESLRLNYSVPEDKEQAVYKYLFDTFSVNRSEEFEDWQVREAMEQSGIPDEDIPSWLQARERPAPRGYAEGASHIQMGTLTPDGVINTKLVDANICPHLILVPEHYNDDGPCKCYDESATHHMMPLGYRWKDGMWR